jgi:copper chaperone
MSCRLPDEDGCVTEVSSVFGPRYPMYYAASESAGPGITMMSVSTRSIAVTGMSCNHCASAVRAEISKLPGVTGVDVDVAGGTVRISGDPLPGDASLREAIEEAGYELAG